jgi:DNA-binding transcriptional ArsR family regulator
MQEGTMDDITALRELSARFKELDKEGGVRLDANWISTQWDSKGEHWYLSGIDDPSLHEYFKWAAERGAVLHRGVGGPDGWLYWLDLLRQESPEYEGGGSLTGANDPEAMEIGIIRNVCRASAEHCFKLETGAIVKKKHRDRWSFLMNSRLLNPASSPISPFTERALQQIARRIENEGESAHTSPQPPTESIGAQLDRLREECRLTVEDLAAALDVDPRSVYRHLSGKSLPRRSHIGAYERLFSQKLERKVVLLIRSGKRQ